MPKHRKKRKVDSISIPPYNYKNKKNLESPISVCNDLSKLNLSNINHSASIKESTNSLFDPIPSKVKKTEDDLESPKTVSIMEINSAQSNIFGALDLTSDLTTDLDCNLDLFNFNLENKYNLEFEYNSISFYKVYSPKYKKKVTLLLNMCNDTYEYINSYLNLFLKDNYKKADSKTVFSNLKKFLRDILSSRISLWNSNSNSKIKLSLNQINEKTDFLIKDFFHFKKSSLNISRG